MLQVVFRYKKGIFWSKLWTQSYFVKTIGNATEDTICEYARNQLNDMSGAEELSQQLEQS
ncbi:MAG: hypothetical protein E6Q33_07565 [Neisseriales bacterium]|nr:MAG: hypothetical protein E6Q33_07565 [Neisseriales bacterium]